MRIAGFAIAAFTLACTNDGVVVKIILQPTTIAWTDEEKLTFSSIYTRFTAEYYANGGRKLKVTPGDAFSCVASSK